MTEHHDTTSTPDGADGPALHWHVDHTHHDEAERVRVLVAAQNADLRAERPMAEQFGVPMAAALICAAPLAVGREEFALGAMLGFLVLLGVMAYVNRSHQLRQAARLQHAPHAEEPTTHTADHRGLHTRGADLDLWAGWSTYRNAARQGDDLVLFTQGGAMSLLPHGALTTGQGAAEVADTVSAWIAAANEAAGSPSTPPTEP